ncbi:MAG TPA: hypothetical protein VFL98_02310 [Candidatus Paceibacterota bacterium]|nr:hypothetical protein [Candidatus Paceibacterota bacterium]
MNTYFVVFCIPADLMADWVEHTPEDERAAQSDQMMQAWAAWRDAHAAMIKDDGQPLGKTKRVTANGIEDARNDLNYYLLIEAESHEAAAEAVKDNPHVQMIPGSYVDVIEMPKMR